MCTIVVQSKKVCIFVEQTDRDMKVKKQIVKADTTDEAKKKCEWATMFQRTNDWKNTNNWICSTFI